MGFPGSIREGLLGETRVQESETEYVLLGNVFAESLRGIWGDQAEARQFPPV